MPSNIDSYCLSESQTASAKSNPSDLSDDNSLDDTNVCLMKKIRCAVSKIVMFVFCVRNMGKLKFDAPRFTAELRWQLCNSASVCGYNIYSQDLLIVFYMYVLFLSVNYY